jgi:hypothetical protein
VQLNGLLGHDVSLARDLRKLAELPERVAHVEEKAQAIRTHGLVLGHHEHIFEELVQGGPELGGRGDCALEVAGLQSYVEPTIELLEGARDLDLRRLDEQRRFEREAQLRRFRELASMLSR